MAIDEWWLDRHREGTYPPMLRFYQWSPVALSLGYHQRQIPDHWRSLTWQGQPVDLVRRPSGGRAVLHQGDLTFAVVTSGLTGDRMQVYKTLCQFLIEGWRSLGVPLHLGQVGRGYIHNPNCFGTATAADLLLPDGAKLIGCAQLRRGDAVLQHGSMRLNPSPELYEQVFGSPMERIALPGAIATSATQTNTVMAALIQSAEACFGVHLKEGALTPEEWSEIQQRYLANSALRLA
jgi:lipoate---protein ligase